MDELWGDAHVSRQLLGARVAGVGPGVFVLAFFACVRARERRSSQWALPDQRAPRRVLFLLVGLVSFKSAYGGCGPASLLVCGLVLSRLAVAGLAEPSKALV